MFYWKRISVKFMRTRANVVQDNWKPFNKFMHYNANSRAKYNSNNRPLRSDAVASWFETRDVIRNITHIFYIPITIVTCKWSFIDVSVRFPLGEREREREGKTFCESRVISAGFASNANRHRYRISLLCALYISLSSLYREHHMYINL